MLVLAIHYTKKNWIHHIIDLPYVFHNTNKSNLCYEVMEPKAMNAKKKKGSASKYSCCNQQCHKKKRSYKISNTKDIPAWGTVS